MKSSILAILLCTATLASAEVPRSPAPEGAAVYFIAPGNGATVATTFTVKFGLEGMGVAPAGVEMENTGHHHLLIDVADLPDPNLPLPASSRRPRAPSRTVEEVVKGKAALKDKAVLVNAQVVKVTNDVMGKNWVHLQDGTGKAADATHDVIATTKDRGAVGDVVKAKGTVRTGVNLGSELFV